MKEIIKMINHMEKEYIDGQIQKFMKVNGNMGYLKDLEKKFLKVQSMKVIGKMVFLTDMENVFLQIKVLLMGIGKMDNQMAKVPK
jgi:hypothetical protein